MRTPEQAFREVVGRAAPEEAVQALAAQVEQLCETIAAQQAAIATLQVGAVGNVTVVAGSSGGEYLALASGVAGFSGTSNLDYSVNAILANFFNFGRSSDSKLDIFIGGFPTHVIIDIFAVVP